ncbi:MAG: queuosine salvage family protein [Chloroflexi bacterium]|nr:queuosine salvage family protein [Chloroflexota bacterium]
MTLGVLESTRTVVAGARHVRIDADAVRTVASRLVQAELGAPAWRVWPHWWDDTERGADYVLVLDALNFCFWGDPKWRVEYQGKTLDGYWALVACLRRAIDRGVPLLDPDYLVTIDDGAVRDLFAGEGEIPLLAARAANLREAGRGMRAVGGSFAPVVEAAGGDVVRLVDEVVRRFPSFDDVVPYDGAVVRFYKRAQILVSDLHGIFEGRGLGQFGNLDALTAFADYKIPQILRAEGILVYEPALATQVDSYLPIPAGHPDEVEIRAATIWACERLRQALAEARASHGEPPLRAFEVDWLLWTLAQDRTFSRPYHRTRTAFY